MENSSNKINFFTPFLYALLVAIGMFFGFKMKKNLYKSKSKSALEEIDNLVKENYVDKVDTDSIETSAIEKYLSKLDPHSVYIPPTEIQSVAEDMEGSFDGIGVEFNIYKDTVYVINVVKKGPSEQAGLMPGDKIIAVNDSIIAGKKIKNEEVIKKLRGLGGTTVRVKIIRGNSIAKNYTITRGPIPLNSVDASYMLNAYDGYIKLNKFSATSIKEFSESIKVLLKAGMKNLVLDLRDNPGGYLEAALGIADEMIGGKQKLVFTKGNHYNTEEYFSKEGGSIETSKIAVLVDENSASASEIMAGIVQDLDRGVVIGRRTFGKGLVQEEYPLSNGGALRLTIARYYLPSGRSIQRNYSANFDDYYYDVEKRYIHGELSNADSFKIKDTLVFRTPKGKKVYGGNGVVPDIFIPIDTAQFAHLKKIMTKDGDDLRQLAITYLISNSALAKKFNSYIDFYRNFNFDNLQLKSIMLASLQDKSYINNVETMNEIKLYLKAQIARILFGSDGYYYIINQNDKAILKAQESFKKAV